MTDEEGPIDAGLRGAVAEACLQSGTVPHRFVRFGLRAGFSSTVGSQRYLRQRHGLDALAIRDAVLSCLRG